MCITLYYFIVYFDILFKKEVMIYIFFKIFISSIFDSVRTNSFSNLFNFIVNIFKRKRVSLSFFLRRNYRDLLFKILFFYYIIY